MDVQCKLGSRISYWMKKEERCFIKKVWTLYMAWFKVHFCTRETSEKTKRRKIYNDHIWTLSSQQNSYTKTSKHNMTGWWLEVKSRETNGRRQYSKMVSKINGDPKVNTVEVTRIKVDDCLAITLDYRDKGSENQ